jgi:formylmethanofuran dehydrogenase subunit E
MTIKCELCEAVTSTEKMYYYEQELLCKLCAVMVRQEKKGMW